MSLLLTGCVQQRPRGLALRAGVEFSGFPLLSSAQGQALRPWGTKAKGIRDPAASEAPGHLPLGPCFVLKADPVPDEMGWEGPEQTVLRNRPAYPPLWQARLRAGFSR